MDPPLKRQRLSRDSEKMARKVRQDGRGLYRRQAAASTDVTVEVAVSVTVQVSVDVDSNGVPTSTTTLGDSSAPAPAAASSTLATVSPAVSPAPSAAASSAVVSVASAAPAASSSLPASATSSVSPLPAIFTTSSTLSSAPVSSSASAAITASSSLAALNSTSSFPPSSSGIVSATLLSALNASSIITDSSLSSTILLSSSSLFSSSLPSSLSSTSEVSSSSALPFVPGAAGVGTESPSPSSVPSGHGRNSTAKPTGGIDGTSPPVVAGAVVGSVGGMAVLLLILVLVARWWKHHSRSVRYESNSESATDLTTHPAPYGPRRPSFLPVGAAAFINRFSGSHQRYTRSSSPTLPDVQETGFQKITGRKMPSQFPTGMEEGPVVKDFEKSAPASAVNARMRGVTLGSPSSSYYRDSNDTTNFFTNQALGKDVAPAPLFASRSEEATPEPASSNYTAADKEFIRPSPARTPNIHTGASYFQDHNSDSPQPQQSQRGERGGYSPRPRYDRGHP